MSSSMGPSGSGAHGFQLNSAGMRRHPYPPAQHPAQPSKPSPAPHNASPYQPQYQSHASYAPQLFPQVNGNVPNGNSRGPGPHAHNGLGQRQRPAPTGRQQQQMPQPQQPNPSSMMFGSMSQSVPHDPIMAHQHQQQQQQQQQQHQGHASHQGHPGQQHQGHQPHQQHQGLQHQSHHQQQQQHAQQQPPGNQQQQQSHMHRQQQQQLQHQQHAQQQHQHQVTPPQHMAHQPPPQQQPHHHQQQQQPTPQHQHRQQPQPQMPHQQQKQPPQPPQQQPQQPQPQLPQAQPQSQLPPQIQLQPQAQQPKPGRNHTPKGNAPKPPTPQPPAQPPQPPQQASRDVEAMDIDDSREGDSEMPGLDSQILQDPSFQPSQPMGEMMSPPPEGGSYPTLEAVQKAVLRYCTSVGYAIVIGRSKKTVPGLKKVLFVCDRAGKPPNRVSPEHRKRKTSSRKCDCPFGFFAIEQRTQWTIRYRPDKQHLQHNHGPSESPSHHPAARKLDSKMVAAVKQLKENGAGVSETLQILQNDNPDCHLLPRDIYNARAAINRNPPKQQSTPGEPEESPTIYNKQPQTNEDKIRSELRSQLSKARDDLKKLEEDKQKEIDKLKDTIKEKDKMIEKFEMFIDICNQRVMVQRERLSGPGQEGNAARTQS